MLHTVGVEPLEGVHAFLSLSGHAGSLEPERAQAIVSREHRGCMWDLGVVVGAGGSPKSWQVTVKTVKFRVLLDGTLRDDL